MSLSSQDKVTATDAHTLFLFVSHKMRIKMNWYTCRGSNSTILIFATILNGGLGAHFWTYFRVRNTLFTISHLVFV